MENEWSRLFAANLRRLRLEAGLTQRAIADAVGYTEKAVSKWERGAALPDIRTLARIAELLHTGLDELVRDGTKIYLLGIDGGGTKTELWLTDAQETPLRRLLTDGCNPMDVGAGEAKKRLSDAINEITVGIPRSAVTLFAGIAGGTSGDMPRMFTEFFSGFGFAGFDCGSDNRNVLAAGLGERDGVTLILGTGICAFRQKNGVCSRVAGWGYLIDGGGSAYHIGRDGIASFYTALDGTGKETALSALIARETPDGEQALLSRIYSEGKKTVASFAPTVFRAAKDGDAVAEAILRKNFAYAARILEAAASPLSGARLPVVLAGGLTREPTTVARLMRELAEPERFELSVLDCPPVSGAIRIAREMAGRKGSI